MRTEKSLPALSAKAGFMVGQASRLPGNRDGCPTIKTPSPRSKNRGFSLFELAVIVLILGLITSLSWRYLGASLQKAERVESNSLLERADWALTGFILANHRLPCPATDHNGVEACGNATEVSWLPYKTLGMADARAGAIRYGVLRRDTAAPGGDTLPTSHPAPALPRSTNLTAQASDRFYPLVMKIGDNLYPALQKLTTSGNPVSSRSIYPPVVANEPLGKVNGLDLCQALRVAADSTPETTHVHIPTPTPRQLAYALALPGALDADGDGNPFDAANKGLAFNPPSAGQTRTNDDTVRAVTPGDLWSRLGCGEAVSAIGHAQANAAISSTMLYQGAYDLEQVLEQTLEMSQIRETLAISDLYGAVGGILGAAAGSLHAAADAAFGNPASIAAAVLMTVGAAVRLPIAVIAMQMANETRNMADLRYTHAVAMTQTLKPFAEDFSQHVVDADKKGLYCGAATTAACP